MGVIIDLAGLIALEAALPAYGATVAERMGAAVLADIRWSGESPSAAGDPPGIASGELAQSVQVVHEGMGVVRVGSSVGYAAALEFGTTKMAARPWLRPALERVRQHCLSILQEGFPDAGS